jgi:RNA polymerase sigma factor (sigma-70 family)
MPWFNQSPKTDQLKDEQLLERYLATNDIKILGELFRAHSSMVYYVCYRYFQDAERSKDASMQIFEELLVKVHRQPIQQFARWLYVLSKNYCLMQLRSGKKIQHVSFDDVIEFPLDEDHTDHEEKEKVLSSLEECMQKLPSRQQKSVDLFFLCEKCYKEIVELTGYTLSEVKSYIQNGKRNLKICMERRRGE